MKKSYIIALICIMSFLLLSTIALIICNVRLSLTEKEFGRKLDEHQMYLDLQNEIIQSNLQNLLDSYNNNTIDIMERFDSMKKRTDAQYSKTVSISKTSESLLDEQKKQTVDISARDNAIYALKESAKQLFYNKNYSKAYDECKKILIYQSDDFEVRMLKAKALYNMNSADSSKYSEILDEINILKTNGYGDDELFKIESVIYAEKGL